MKETHCYLLARIDTTAKPPYVKACYLSSETPDHATNAITPKWQDVIVCWGLGRNYEQARRICLANADSTPYRWTIPFLTEDERGIIDMGRKQGALFRGQS